MRNRIVYLNNETSAQIGFSKKRNMKEANIKKESEEDNEHKVIIESKKNEFHGYLTEDFPFFKQ